MGLVDFIAPILNIVDRIIPDPAQKAAAQLEVLKLQQSGELAQLTADVQLATAQTDINKVEAASPSLLVSGPRPALMWVGVLGIAYQWILVPIGTFAYTLYTSHGLPVPPPEMSTDVMWLVGSLMGLHVGARSVEKIKGVAAQ
jgi:hypothetical protein